jgi:hypothetical protein
MPLDVHCPMCNHAFPVTEARSAVGVDCPGCAAELTAEFRKRPTPVPGQHPYELFVSPGRPAGAAAPAAGKKPLPLDDDAEEAARGGGGMGVVVLAGVGALVLALGGLVGTGVLLYSNLDTSDSTISNLSSDSGSGSSSKGGTRGGTPVNPRPRPDPVRPGPRPQPTPPEPFQPEPFPPPKKKDTFELRPAAGVRQAISPTPLEASPKTVELPGPAAAVAVGGNGRYVVFHVPSKRQLAVFDVNTGTVRPGPEPADDGKLLLAAGMNRLAVLAPGNVLRVYSLPDLRRLYDATGPQLPHNASQMVMGSATNGPLLATNPFGESVLVEIGEREAKPVEGSNQSIGGGIIAPIRMSASGRLVVRGGFGTKDRTAILTEFGGKWRTVETDLACACPGPDGRTVFGYGAILNERGQPVGARVGGPGNGVWYVPAASGTGNQFVRLAGTRQGNKDVLSVSVHANPRTVERDKSATQLGVLPEMDGLVNSFFANSVALDQHVFLVPEARLLAVLTVSKDKLVLRRVDVR